MKSKKLIELGNICYTFYILTRENTSMSYIYVPNLCNDILSITTLQTFYKCTGKYVDYCIRAIDNYINKKLELL